MSIDVSVFNMVMFASEALFLITVVACSYMFELDDVQTARLSQTINAISLLGSFYFGWKTLPKVPASHTLPIDPSTGKQQSLLSHGFFQIWKTAQKINTEYSKGLRWFLVATVFAEAAAEAFAIVAVVYMDEELGMTTVQIGTFFLIGIFSLIPGTFLSDVITARTNPNTSWKLSMLSLQATAVIGALLLHNENVFPGGYIWAVFVGLNLGWFYPAEVRIRCAKSFF